MQFFGVVLGLVASCALLPGHNRVKAPSTLSASPAVLMVATAMPEPRQLEHVDRLLPLSLQRVQLP